MAVDEAEVSRGTLKGKPGKHPCSSCSYSAMTAGSLQGHVAMAHPEAIAAGPASVASPKRKAAAAREATPRPVAAAGQLLEIQIRDIEVASNVREDLGDVAELAASIGEHGLLEPVTVTELDNSKAPELPRYRLLAGHRRLAATKLAGRDRIRAIVDPRHELGESGSGRSVVQLIENVQRADLNPIDVAKALQAMHAARPALTHAELAKLVQKDRTWVTNMLRLLETAPEVQAAVAAETITATHARAIAGVDVDLQARLLDSVVDRQLSAHATEGQAQYFKDQAKSIRDRAAKVNKVAASIDAALRKVANPAKAQIGLADYGGTSTALRAALEAAGMDWKVVDGYGWFRVKNAGECGCDGVWRVEVSMGGAVSLAPACNSDEHAPARKAKVDEQWQRDQAKANEERRLERAAIEAASIRVKDAVGEILAARPPSELAHRLLVWGLMVADEEPDEQLVAKYLAGETEGQENILYEVDDAAWLLTEAIPAADLEDVQGRLVSRLFGSYMAGPGVKAAVEEWSKATHPETFELAEPEAKSKKERKRLAKELRLGDPVVIGGDEYLVLGIIYPAQEPGMTERPPTVVQLGLNRPVKAVDYRAHHVQLADLTPDAKERVWRAPQGALLVAKPSQRDTDAIAAARATGGPLECIGSVHVPGCAHQGGQIPPAKPAPAAG